MHAADASQGNKGDGCRYVWAENAVLVLNNSKVVEARLAALKQETKGKAEVMLLSPEVRAAFAREHPAARNRQAGRQAGTRCFPMRCDQSIVPSVAQGKGQPYVATRRALAYSL